MGEESVEERGRSRLGLFWWAVVLCSATIVLAIGGPLIGRGTAIGTTVVRTALPWSQDTPSSFRYRLPPVHDTVEVGTPSRTRIREALVDEQRVALWDPFANGGTPLGSQPNTGVFAPLNWPLLLFGVQFGAAWAAFLRLAVAAGATFFLLRRLGVSRFAAVCGGLIYCTSGFIVSWNNWPQADLAAMIPLLFLVADRLVARRRLVDLALVALVVTAMLLEGYPPLLIATFYALAGFLLVRWWESARDPAGDGPTLATRLRDTFRPAWLLIGAAGLGLALAAFQVLPFLVRVGTYDTSYRSAGVDRAFPASALLTAAFPWVNGNPSRPGTEIRVDYLTNFSITEQFVFLGAAAVVFVLVALFVGRPKTVSTGTYRYCAAVLLFLLVALFGHGAGPAPNVGGWLRSALYALPGMNQIPVHRLVAPLLFVATLVAGFGIERVVSADRPFIRFNRRWLVRAGLLLALSGYLFALGLRDELRLTKAVNQVNHYGVIEDVAQRRYFLESAIVPLLIAIATILAVVCIVRSRGTVRRVAIGAIPVLLAIEGLMVTTTMFPRVDDRDYYPTTAATRYLSDHLEHQRVAPTGSMLEFATNAVYGLRSVGGHSFTSPSWRQLLFAGVGKGDSTPTQLRIPQNDPAAARSPVLDRLGARYFVDAPYTVLGSRESMPATPRDAVVSNRRVATGVLGPGPLRAVVLQVRGPDHLRGDLVYLQVRVRTPSGRVVARGRTRLISQPTDQLYSVPVVGEHLPSTVPWTVEVGLSSDAHDSVRLGATATGQVGLGAIRPADDGLELVEAEPGANIYRRLHALPRIRWASRAETVTSSTERLKLLAGDRVDPDTVVLSHPGPAATGAPARVAVKEDSGDRIRVVVDAKGPGYLVVGDAIQDDWSATVDGRPAELRDADHALAAVAVPAGRHVVDVKVTPRGWRAGVAISVAALVMLALILALALFRRRRAPDPASDDEALASDDDDHELSAVLDAQ